MVLYFDWFQISIIPSNLKPEWIIIIFFLSSWSKFVEFSFFFWLWCLNHGCCPLSTCVGVGGNLVAIQASRLSTFLHFWSIPGVLPYKMRQHWPNPYSTFFSSGNAIMQNRPYNIATDWPSFIKKGVSVIYEISEKQTKKEFLKKK